MITFLLIEDNQDYADSLVLNAKISEIMLLHRQNYEDGFKQIRNNPEIKALIFDAKCWKTRQEQDEESEPSDDALGEGLRLLADYEKSTGKYLPLAVNTGYTYPSQFYEPLLKPFQAKVFEKGKTNPDDIFEYLKLRIQNTENYQIERQYVEVFEIFEKGYLKEDIKNNLLDIIKNQNKVELPQIRKNLALIRSTKETVMQVLSNQKPNFKQPLLIIQYSEHLIHKMASNYGSHNPRFDDIKPTQHTVICLFHALMDILLWFKKEMEN